MPISIPLQLDNEKLVRTINEKESIEQFLHLLVSSHLGCFLADKEFGFSLINHRFEDIDTNVNSFWEKYSIPADASKEIKGKGNSPNTFAQDLKMCIEKYEPRLTNVYVDNPSITYENGKMKTVFTIKGKYKEEWISHDIETIFW